MDMTTQGGMTEMAGMTGHPMKNGSGMMMMKMYFHTDYIDEVVLFKEWKIHDVGTLVVSMIAVFVMALLYEGLRFGRQRLIEYAASQKFSRFANIGTRTDPSDSTAAYVGRSPFTIWHLAQSLLHMVHAFISYILMMVFMTYNVWLCLALVLGAGVGYFAFGWRTKVVVDVTDHCH